MATLLEQHLYRECEKQSSLQRLRSQWDFDRELIPKALQSIGNMFPHYSRHDQSHSNQILVNIERILGEERISKLSATDTWLLLEAAYWHDIGMVISHSAIEEALADSDFVYYVKSIAENKNHELHGFAKNFNLDNAFTSFSGVSNPIDALEQFRYLMAEWFRRAHSKRAEKITIDPWGQAGISSPRTELIPDRFFSLLGKICLMHGESFETTLEEMKFKETGIANDDCHPRFIACILRLGDLLDIEDNRFCPVMQSIVGENRPSLSKAHEDKHKSLKHFRLDSERIEIEAVCNEIEGYIEQWRWLDYLEYELKQQMSHWSDISPSKEFGLLPTLGQINLSIKGKELINKGERPQFKLDQSRVMELLKGDNLYGRYDAVREIIQNAIDATLIRIWLESKRNGDVIESSPDGEFTKKYLGQYPIQIEFKRLSPLGEVNSGQIEWELCIQDSGIGIGLEDLKFISNVGSSSGNIRKQKIIEEMPEWMRPSGVFGLGLQSLFMWTDQFEISTQSYFEQTGLNVTFHNPNNKNKGLIEIERVNIKQQETQKKGSKLSFRIFTEKDYSGRFSIEGVVADFLQHYDPLLDNEFPQEAYALVDKVLECSSNTIIPVKFFFEGNLMDNQPNKLKDKSSSKMFIESTNSFFNVTLLNGSDLHRSSNDRVYYRGQLIEKLETKDKSYSIDGRYFFNFDLDILSGKASEWLTFDRSRLTSEGVDKIDDLVEENLMEWVRVNQEQLLKNENYRIALSCLAKLRQNMEGEAGKFWFDLLSKCRDDWLQSKYFKQINESLRSGTNTINNFLELINNGVGQFISLSGERDLKEYQLAESMNAKEIYSVTQIEGQWLLEHWWKSNIKNAVKVHQLNPKSSSNYLPRFIYEFVLGKETSNLKILADEEVLRDLIAYKIFNLSHSGTRLMYPYEFLPDNLNRAKILVKKDTMYYGTISLFDAYPKEMQLCLLPFECSQLRLWYRADKTISLNRFDEFIDWIMKHLQNSQVSKEEVKEEYEKIIKYFDEYLMVNNRRWQEARKSKN